MSPHSLKESLNEVGGFLRCRRSEQRLSTRQLEVLARGYFEGRGRIKEEIRAGHFDWSLQELKGVASRDDLRSERLTEVELSLIRDLDYVSRALSRITLKSRGAKLTSGAFFAEADLFCGGLLSRFDTYKQCIEELYAQCRNKKYGAPTFPKGDH